MTTGSGLALIEGLRWAVGDRRCRLGADALTVPRGEVAVVVADPDAVTMLADVVIGLSAPLGGRVVVDGDDVTGRTPDPRRAALVPAGGALLPHLTVARNIQLALKSPEREVAELLHRLQLEGAGHLPPLRLSPDQRLRVAVARALITMPKVIVIEDLGGQRTSELALDAATEQNAAVLVVTDALHPVRPPAARVVGWEEAAADAG